MRAPKLIGLARVLAWLLGYGAAFMVAYSYAALGDASSVSRWSDAAKSILFALRIPVINLLMIGLVDLLSRSAARALPEHRLAAERAGATLLCAAGLKAWLAARELLAWPHANAGVRIWGILTVLGGVALAAWFARPLWAPNAYQHLRWTRLELLVACLLLVAIVGLNLPFGP